LDERIGCRRQKRNHQVDDLASNHDQRNDDKRDSTSFYASWFLVCQLLQRQLTFFLKILVMLPDSQGFGREVHKPAVACIKISNARPPKGKTEAPVVSRPYPYNNGPAEPIATPTVDVTADTAEACSGDLAYWTI